MLEKELKVLNSDKENSPDVRSNYQQINENQSKINNNLAKLREAEDTVKRTTSVDNRIFPHESVSRQLSELSEKLIKKGNSVEKELKDEIELLMIGLNNINHYIEGLINENDRITNYIDEKFDNVNSTIKINIWLSVILVLMIIAEVFIFFNF